MAQWWTWGLRSDLGAGPLKSHRGLHIIWLNAGPCIIESVVFCIASAIFELRTLHDLCTLMWFKNLYNNSFIRAIYVMYYVSLLQWWQPDDLGYDYPSLLKDGMSQLVSEHYEYNMSPTAIFLKTYGEEMLRCPYKDYNSLNRWQANWVLLYPIYYSVMTHIWKVKKVSFLPLGEVNPGSVPSRHGLLEDNTYHVVGVTCLSCDWPRPCT
jgi:hypothetical protein